MVKRFRFEKTIRYVQWRLVKRGEYMKDTGIGYLQLGISGRPKQTETLDELDDLETCYIEEFLSIGTGVEASLIPYRVTIEYRFESFTHEVQPTHRVWTAEMYARNVNEAKQLATRDFRLLEDIVGDQRRREIISVVVFGQG